MLQYPGQINKTTSSKIKLPEGDYINIFMDKDTNIFYGIAPDGILYPISSSGNGLYRAILTQNTVSTTSGLLVVGKEYIINTLQAGDDFANVGYVSINTPFIATGTTPTTWTNNTVVYNNTDSAPTPNVLGINTIGNIVWSRVDIGIYQGKLVSAFTVDKTFLPVPSASGNTNSLCTFERLDADTVYITVLDFTLSNADLDGIMYVEISVY